MIIIGEKLNSSIPKVQEAFAKRIPNLCRRWRKSR